MSTEEKTKKNVLITGGTGLLGTALTKNLLQAGYNVRYLSRSSKEIESIEVYTWDIRQGKVDQAAFKNLHALIHLAGANVGDKAWTTEQRKRILSSRTDSTALLIDALKKEDKKPEVVVCASAMGIYMGQGGGKLFEENSEQGKGFLAEVTQAWEKATDAFRELKINCTQLRIGIVLSPDGGALPSMLLPVKLFAGSHLGSGEQRMSWIHLEDVVRMFQFSMEHKLDGVYNAVGPAPVSNTAFMAALRKVTKRPSIAPPVPGFAIKLIMGERASLVLEDLAVSAKKIQDAGFQFKHPDLHEALTNLIAK